MTDSNSDSKVLDATALLDAGVAARDSSTGFSYHVVNTLDTWESENALMPLPNR
jgi:hypothetical protein